MVRLFFSQNVVFILSHLLRRFLSEEARGFDDQNDNQQCKRDNIAEICQSEGFCQTLHHADEQCAHHSAGHGADAAHHSGDKRLDARGGACR